MKNGIATPSRLISALDACRTKLKAFIRARIPQRDEADDILQEVTYQLIRVEQPVENIAAWLFLPLAGDFSEEEEGAFPEDELAETLFGVAQTPEEAYLKTLLWEAVNQALAELPPAQREAFEKTELQGYSYRELAEETGASEQALLSRKHKAVLYLRTRLRALYDDLLAD